MLGRKKEYTNQGHPKDRIGKPSKFMDDNYFSTQNPDSGDRTTTQNTICYAEYEIQVSTRVMETAGFWPWSDPNLMLFSWYFVFLNCKCCPTPDSEHASYHQECLGGLVESDDYDPPAFVPAADDGIRTWIFTEVYGECLDCFHDTVIGKPNLPIINEDCKCECVLASCDCERRGWSGEGPAAGESGEQDPLGTPGHTQCEINSLVNNFGEDEMMGLWNMEGMTLKKFQGIIEGIMREALEDAIGCMSCNGDRPPPPC